MSFVQGNRNASIGTSGGAGPSLAGVGAGHGLFYWMFVDLTVTGSPTIADSSGTTWALVQNIPLTTDSESLLCFKTTSAVGAGTHTITPTYAGGGSFFGWLIEDTGAYDGSAVGQRLSGPGAGNTLKPGGNVGVAGDTAYMLAVDALNTGATFVPGLNGFTSIDSGNNASIGTWRLGWNAGVGGTNPAMATGSGDTGGTDEYGVIAIAFLGGTVATNIAPAAREPGLRLGTPLSRLRSGLGYTTATVTTGTLSGVSMATAEAVGNLTGTGTLSGVAHASSYGVGNLTATGVLSGVSVATTEACGGLLGTGILAGVAVATTEATGDLENAASGGTSGVSVATSNATGALTGTGTLAGAAVATSEAVCALQGTGTLSGVSIATSAASGALTGAGQLSGVSVSITAAVGSLTGSVGTLAGVSVSTTVAIGDLQPLTSGAMQGVCIATSYAVGDLQGILMPPVAPAAGAGLLPGDLGTGLGPYKRPGQVFGEPDPVSPWVTSRAEPLIRLRDDMPLQAFPLPEGPLMAVPFSTLSDDELRAVLALLMETMH